LPFINVNKLKVKQPRQGWRGRFFHSDHMTFAYYEAAAGATIHKHSHENDEVWNVIEGQLKITIAGKTKLVGPGDAAVIPPDTTHAVLVIKDARALVVDHPCRESIGGVEL
jgi:quercetin dioxygenase-like cupin family protein